MYMRLLHRSNEEKELLSCRRRLYDAVMRVAIGLVLLTCGTPALAAAGEAASNGPAPRVRLVLSVIGPRPFGAGVMAAAIREADTLWAPHRVAVALRGATSPEGDAEQVIPLAI